MGQAMVVASSLQTISLCLPFSDSSLPLLASHPQKTSGSPVWKLPSTLATTAIQIKKRNKTKRALGGDARGPLSPFAPRRSVRRRLTSSCYIESESRVKSFVFPNKEVHNYLKGSIPSRR
jgi:hypothetical protein